MEINKINNIENILRKLSSALEFFLFVVDAPSGFNGLECIKSI